MNQIRWLPVILMFGMVPTLANAEAKGDTLTSFKKPTYPKQGGNFSVGFRNTYSLFAHGDPRDFGGGIGAHARLQVIDRVNTEWFLDVLSSNIKNKAHRTDIHVGWSVMFYLLDPKAFNRKLTPYVVVGHCFDETIIKINGKDGEKASRFSSAVQAGLGCHYNVTPRFDVSLCAQYMLHLGKELHAHEEEDGNIELETHKNAGWEGHLLVSLSVNYKFLQLWKPRK